MSCSIEGKPEILEGSLSLNTVQLGGRRCSDWWYAACWMEEARDAATPVRSGVGGRVDAGVPPDVVDEVIAQVGRTERRHRSLSARVMAYFSVGMALYSEGSYGDVLAQLTDGLSWASGWSERYSPTSKSAIFQARARLGAEPLAALFSRVARPIGTEAMAGVWLVGRRLVAIDGTCRDVAGTPANAEHFGRPGVDKGEQAAFPQARVVALAECGTHVVFAAEVGAYAQSEAVLADRLVERVAPGMLLTAGSSPLLCGAQRSARARTFCAASAPTRPIPSRFTSTTSPTARGWPTWTRPIPRPHGPRSRCGSVSSTTPSMTVARTPRGIASSPPF